MEEKVSFEEALMKLDSLINHLESGEGNLAEMIGCYEECMKLVNLCNDRLDAYEKKITMLNETWQA